MCGLAGAILKYSDSVAKDEWRRRCTAMARMLRHRGPDGWGCWFDGDAALVHTRLRIIDISDAAAQPMHDELGQTHVVFNGEIYNFQVLREELRAAGYRFRNNSDTEVLVHGYREWGTGLFARLVGMFAIAIWDSRRRQMVFARDRFGEKPLYYMERPDAFLFGSEAKAILAWPGVPRTADVAALHDYLTFGFTLGPGTAFVGIRRLPPAHFMVVTPGAAPRIERYWRLPPPNPAAPRRKLDDIKHELIERLQASVKACLISDVPLGAFLSGGVDSSSVVAMMARSRGGGIETFSSGFGFGDYDETRFAKLVADRYGTEHRMFTFDSELIGSLADLAWYYGEPFSDSSALVTYALSRETRRSVTVALTGDGADEIFLGYQRYFAYGDMRRSNPPRGARKLSELYAESDRGLRDKFAASDAYGYLLERFREEQKLAGYDLALLPYLDRCSYDRLLPFLGDGGTPEEAAGRFDVGTYLPDDLLVKVDIAAMAHGLETRAPYLNHEFAEWAVQIPGDQKIWEREGKALLKSALEPFVPHECMYRTKVGFRVPVAKFMREEIREQTDAVLLSERFLDRAIVRADYIRTMLAEHRSQEQEHGTRLWSLLTLEMWFRTWIDADGAKPLSGDDDPFAAFAPGKPPPRAAELGAPYELADPRLS